MEVAPLGIVKEGKSYCTEVNCSCRREEWEYVRETVLETPRSVKKEGGGATGSGADIPLQP